MTMAPMTIKREMHERGLHAASKVLRLIGADRAAFVAGLLDPPEPNEALKAAAEEHTDATEPAP